MKIRLEDIPRQGRDVSAHTDEVRAAVAFALEGEIHVLDATARVERAQGGADVTVTGHAEATCTCARCGADTPVVLDVDEHLMYRPRSQAPTEEEVELDERDLDVSFLEADTLDLDAAFAEAFALALPMRVTCAGDACSLPTEASGDAGEEASGHPAFSALKDLF